MDGGGDTNRLINETSPYLLQHARNPVDWYPWGDEAFDRAKSENKPIFLSIGYSTCHWCHVMERESFERDDVAAILNEHYVAIKVDREERPDIDAIYMAATQLVTGGGGWPNSVWLTPDGRPWFAGTYFPREDSHGRPGFKTVLTQLAEVWTTHRDEVETQADQLAEAMERFSSAQQLDATGELARDLVGRVVEQLRRTFDERYGGFGAAPKFPPHASLAALLYEYRRTQDAPLLEMATRTLDAMASGGMHDQIGGGFHRYSTDERWLVPHFEKMLYDNAQLARAYTDAWLVTKDPRYRRVAVGMFEWVVREMTSKEGGFYSALDADSEGKEGTFYVWRRDEILDVLGERDGELFCRVYGVEAGGNFAEEVTGERLGTNILHLPRPLDEVARAEGLEPETLDERLGAMREKLLAVRNARVWPHLDDKVLAAWNGLMIGSLAYGGRHLDEPRYIEAAKRAADFVLDTMRVDGRLRRTYRDGEAKLNAYLDDYAFLADGLLDVYEVTQDARTLDAVKAFVDVLINHYHDGSGGFFFTSSDHEELLIRKKDPFDGAIPSGNGVAARVLVRLATITGEARYFETARETLEAFLGLMERAPTATQTLIVATAMYLGVAEPVAAEGHPPLARARNRPVTAEAFLLSGTLASGASAELEIRLTIDDGWHINSHEPLSDNLIATTVTVVDHAGITPGDIAYPDGTTIQLGFSDEPLSVYQGEVRIIVPVAVDTSAVEGSAELSVTIRFQACNDAACLAPETVTLTIPLAVEATKPAG